MRSGGWRGEKVCVSSRKHLQQLMLQTFHILPRTHPFRQGSLQIHWVPQSYPPFLFDVVALSQLSVNCVLCEPFSMCKSLTDMSRCSERFPNVDSPSPGPYKHAAPNKIEGVKYAQCDTNTHISRSTHEYTSIQAEAANQDTAERFVLAEGLWQCITLQRFTQHFVFTDAFSTHYIVSDDTSL